MKSEKPTKAEVAASSQLAFDMCKKIIVETFDGHSEDDYANRVWVVQNLVFLALSNGCKLSVEEAIDCLAVLNDRLRKQILESLPTLNEQKH